MDLSPQPLISVIVPFYNARATLQLCLESLERQTDPQFQVIAVDDCSTDDSWQIARPICDRAGFRLLRLPFNKGQAVARNAGAQVAEGEILAFMDADVVAPEHWLARYRTLILAQESPDVICSGYDVCAEDPPAALFASHEAFYRRLNLRSLRLRTMTAANCVMHRRVFDDVGEFPEYYVDPGGDTAQQKAASTNEDSELGFLIAEQGREVRWTHDNRVRHYFPDTWRGYLALQRAYARAGVLSVFRFPKMLFVDDLYSSERIAPQLAVALLLLVSPLAVLLGVEGLWAAAFVLVGCLLFLWAYHFRFFRYLGPQGMGGYRRWRVFLWMSAARVVWLFGVALGVRDGLKMCWKLRKTQQKTAPGKASKSS